VPKLSSDPKRRHGPTRRRDGRGGNACRSVSLAILDNGRVYRSGQIAQGPTTGTLIDGGVAAQTAQAIENVEAVLAAAGKSLADALKVTVYLTDMKNFAEMNRAYAECFRVPYPGRTTVAVAALPLGAAVEIEVEAN
jgi:2-iminobutanoate/2-iminopropanoate deaminase